jgi:hypothetical protein
MVINHSKLPVGIQTWIWVLKIRLSARIFVPVGEEVKDLTEERCALSFTLQQM